MEIKNRIQGNGYLNFLLKIFKKRETGIFTGLIILFLFFSIMSPIFLSINNLINIVRQSAILGIVSVGMTLVIISGEIDLSVGSVYGLGAMLSGHLMVSGVPVIPSILLALLAGVVIGLLNGTLTTYGRIPSLIVTLGMLHAARGAALIITDGAIISLSSFSIEDPMLSIYQFIGRGFVLELIPNLVVALIIIFLIGYFIFHKTVFGFYIKAVGGSSEAARVSGINPKHIKIITFCILGFLASLGGILNLAFLNSAQGTMGQGFELDVISATILGGTSLKGGEGSILGTLIGVLIMGVLRNGLVLIGVSPFAQMVLVGFVLIIAVGIDMWM